MNTLPADLSGLIINFLDAAESIFFGASFNIINIYKAIRTKNFKFILYYLNFKKYRHYVGDIHITRNESIEYMNVIDYIYEQMTDITTMKILIRTNNIKMLFKRFNFIQHSKLDYVFNELIITAIDCKNREVITKLKNRSKIVQEWISPIWNAEKILKANFNGDVELLDLVITDLIVDGILGDYSMEYTLFNDWQNALNIMLEKGDYVCAEYIQHKLIEQQYINEYTSQ